MGKLGIMSSHVQRSRSAALVARVLLKINGSGRSARMKQETSDHDKGRRAPATQSKPHWVGADAVLEGMSAGLFGYEKSKTGFSIVWASAGFTEVTGYHETEVVGKKLDFFYGSRTDPLVVRSINRAH